MTTKDEFTEAFDTLVGRLRHWRETVADRRAVPETDLSDLRATLRTYTFQEARPLNCIVNDVADLMERWTVHTTHPGYFGLFNANVHTASVTADALVAGYNPQVGLRSHSPAANEIEQCVLGYFSRAFGFETGDSIAHFATGGSEANFSAIAAALTAAFPAVAQEGLQSLSGQPVFYVSREAHHSMEKSAHLLGLGRSAVRWIETDKHYRMSPQALVRAIDLDRGEGKLPFLVVGTAGTTTLGTIDPLRDLAKIARDEDLWLHVDAAWGGGAILSPGLRRHLDGIELSDSVTCDAHKWLSVSMGAGMLFCKHAQALSDAFGVDAPYVTDSIRGQAEPFSTTLQWSRRFIGLKLFMTMAHLGERGMVAAIDHQAEMGTLLRRSLEQAGWILVADSPFPLVCFTHPAIQKGAISTRSLLDQVYTRGRLWISEVRAPKGESVLRACICNYKTSPQDIEHLVHEVNRCV